MRAMPKVFSSGIAFKSQIEAKKCQWQSQQLECKNHARSFPIKNTHRSNKDMMRIRNHFVISLSVSAEQADSTDLPPPVYEPVMTAQPQSFGATQTLAGGPNPLYFV
ncbi:hypothetical protein PRIPAC_74617 [Pristionchus pacificus]|uniref:Uncharacterized protein n=1 Tax=Pristionchus pacificus TaxID=54126 RepID=A0A2A6BZW0_PRIPA|nr:hypothetical protein PRIPAC_74617 [Pristionchus pacificus]|eukprot:PDM71303.1 hypothetical protein PRIPAC_37710 [Pristionchus pacificus]